MSRLFSTESPHCRCCKMRCTRETGRFASLQRGAPYAPNCPECQRQKVMEDVSKFLAIPDELKDTKVCEYAVSKVPRLLRAVPDDLKTRSMCDGAVRENGQLLEFVPARLQTTEMVLPVIKKHPHLKSLVKLEVDHHFEDVDCEANLDECSICLGKDADPRSKIKACGHVFHKTCLNEWAKVNSSCPICRNIFC